MSFLLAFLLSFLPVDLAPTNLDEAGMDVSSQTTNPCDPNAVLVEPDSTACPEEVAPA